jgi:hypothetical protein
VRRRWDNTPQIGNLRYCAGSPKGDLACPGGEHSLSSTVLARYIDTAFKTDWPPQER